MNASSVSGAELFHLGPYLAVALSVAGFSLRLAWCWRADGRAEGVESSGWNLLGQRRFGRIALGLLLLGHLVAAAAPSLVLRWNGHPVRLYLLEGTALALGLLALLGLLGGLRHHLAGAGRALVEEIADAVVLSSLLLVVITGVTVAVYYRWASSWGAAIVVPYIHSLARAEPNPALMAEIPLLAQLHVAGGLCAVAVLPFSGMGSALVMLARRVTRASTDVIKTGAAALGRRVSARGRSAWIWPDEDLLDALADRRKQTVQRRARREPVVPAESSN